ncbi:MAG: tyrosine-type recombinase/integrase [Actinobacteria bacterium]|nr:tyrosine-type recombinase/integrase [Actinomycetota bacterium]
MTAEPLRVLEGGRAPQGWEELWACERWRQCELPHGDLGSEFDGGAILDFGGLAQPWLREAAKRWARARLLASMSPRSMSNYLFHLRAFSRWLAERAAAVGSPAAITRELLEDYMLSIRASRLAASTKQARIGTLRAFLEEQREDGLAGLGRRAVIHAAEIPKVDDGLPKGLERRVFDQFVDPANLALLASEQHRTVVLVLAFTGLRVSSIVTLARDALEIGSDDQPYLRYRNVKLRREAVIPIGPALTEQLRRQEEYLKATYGAAGTDFLLPSPPRERQVGGLGGGHHISRQMVRIVVKSYVRKAEIRDGDGRLASWVHPHLFRHHLGTSMGDGVPLPVIQKLLDHASMNMTARYAHLHDETLRKEITRWQERINIRGERIALPLEGPLGQAAWMKERIAHARQALPNGYCGLPLVQTCPHPNACLGCDNFLTDPSFRAVHEQQLARTRELRDRAEGDGSLRLVEVLEHDERSLTRILDGLDELEADLPQSDPTAPIDVVELAKARQRASHGDPA